MDRRWVVGGVGAIAVLGLLILAGLILADDDPGPAAPRPVPTRTRFQAAPRSQRAALPPPEGTHLPNLPAPEARVEATHLTPEERQKMNVSVDDAMRAARDECLKPWIESLDTPDESEFVMDAVTYDGKVVDIGLRSMQQDIPADVLSCVDDKAWAQEWPEWDLEGELRLQRHFTISGRPTVQPPPEP